MSKLQIAAVSYLNTKPFIYGIKNCLNANDFELKISPPAICADIILKNEADIGLIPVASLPKLKDYKIISNFCIGSERKVESVCLYSNSPLTEIQKIHLDFESKTSVNLVKILASKYWKVNPVWETGKPNFETNIKAQEGAVVIGDKTFKLKGQYKYVYDLASEWFNYTGLPFVFACWVGRKDISSEKIALFNNSLKFGVNHIEYSIKEFNQLFGDVVDLNNYFKNCISFDLTPEKKQGLRLYLELLTENNELINNLFAVN